MIMDIRRCKHECSLFPDELDLPGVAPSRQKRSRETTLALLTAGADMLRTRSLAELSIEALCAEVGATVGAFYSRFESKEAYFNALMALAARDGERRLCEMAADTSRRASGSSLSACAADSDTLRTLQQISVGVAEEQRAMAERLIGRRRQQADAMADEFIGAGVDLGGQDLEGELERGAAVAAIGAPRPSGLAAPAPSVLPPSRHSIQPGDSSRDSGQARGRLRRSGASPPCRGRR